VESTLNSLMQALSHEREARREAEATCNHLTAEREELLASQARASADSAASLREALLIISQLRDALHHSHLPDPTTPRTPSHEVAMSLVGALESALQGESGPLKGEPKLAAIRGVVKEALTISMQSIQHLVERVVPPPASSSLTSALASALLDPLLLALPDSVTSLPLSSSLPGTQALDSQTKKKFVMWLAAERERRHKAEATLSDATEALARSESSRMDATQRWLNAVSRIEGVDPSGAAGITTPTRDKSFDILERSGQALLRKDSSKASLDRMLFGSPSAVSPPQRRGTGLFEEENVSSTEGPVFDFETSNKITNWDMTTPLCFLILVLLYHQFVGFY